VAPLEKIRMEEMYRAKMIDRFAKGEARQSGLITFFNTNLGLFLLSTVFISAFSWAYTTWTAYTKHKEEIEHTRQKLGLEIMNRLGYVAELQRVFPFGDRKVIQTALTGFDNRANTNPSWVLHYSPVFPEYEERSFLSLLWELETISDQPKRQQLRRLHTPIETAKAYLDRLEYTSTKSQKTEDGKIETFSLSATDQNMFLREVLEPIRILQNPNYYEAR
jgi:hypothetical protein